MIGALPIGVVVVDDEPLARGSLRLLIERDPDLTLLGECGSGTRALSAIEGSAPELLFLDVKLPGALDGFDVLHRLPPPRPFVVFVTAHDGFALRAFEVDALDYLLKPFGDARFFATVERAKQRIRERRVAQLIKDLSGARAGGPERISIKEAGRIYFVDVPAIDWVEARDYYVELHVGAATHLLRESINSLERRLPAQQFVRIHRSTIINVNRIRELMPLFHGEYQVVLVDGTRLKLSRTRRDRLRPFVDGR